MKVKVYQLFLIIVIIGIIIGFFLIKNNTSVKQVLNSNVNTQNIEEISNNEINDNKEISNIDEEELSKLSGYILIDNNNKINTNDIYALVCKHEFNESNDNTLVAINKKDNSEIPLIRLSKDFYSGTFDFYDNKLYFYDFSENSFHGFYMLDFSNNNMLQQIYSVEEDLAYLDDIQYYDEKIYYTADLNLYSLDISSKEVKSISDINNLEFHINKETGMLYYTDSDKTLYEMDLKTNDRYFIAYDAAPRYLSENKLIYEANSEYIEYDLSSKSTKKITNSWGGSVGEIEIARYNGYYLYIDNTPQLVKKTDDGKEEKLRKSNYLPSFVILSNDKLLIQEEDDYGTIHENYIYDLKTNEIKETDNSFNYYYEKII